MRYNLAAVSHIGKVRSNNQDNYFCNGKIREPDSSIKPFESSLEDESYWTIAVFDGMGGEKDGEVASLIAAELTSDYCKNCRDQINIEELINSINHRICEEIESRKCRMGSTCAFLEFSGNRSRSWNVGDSRAYLFHDCTLTRLTEDHTEEASLNAIFNKQYIKKPGSENRLTQNLGIPEDDFVIEPFISEWKEIERGDILMLCSDGLTHMVSDESICAVLNTESGISNKCDKLLQRALENGGLDNITIIIAEAC